MIYMMSSKFYYKEEIPPRNIPKLYAFNENTIMNSGPTWRDTCLKQGWAEISNKRLTELDTRIDIWSY